MTTTYLKNTNEILNDIPVLVVKLILSQFQTFLGSDLVDCWPIRTYELHHIVRRIPPGHDIAGDEPWFKTELATNAAPGRESDCGRMYDGK